MGGTFPAVWLAHIGFGMSLAIYILRNYMATLPKTVIESAKIDGASHYQTFFRLILPMSVPALAAFASSSSSGCGTTCWSRWCSSARATNEPVTVNLTNLDGQLGSGLEPGRRPAASSR